VWWSEKCLKLEEQKLIQDERDELQKEVNTLMSQLDESKACNRSLRAEKRNLERRNDSLVEHNSHLSETLRQTTAGADELRSSIAAISKPLNSFGGFTKIHDKTSLVAAAGSTVVGLLSILMRKTQAVTWLHILCETIFDDCIFGAEATKKVMAEMYKRHYFKEQRGLFAPWKVLRAIDQSAVGGLNYNGIETLRSVEGLEKYERGVLPSRLVVQRASYDLQEIGQTLVPFEKKESNLGEMYQYNYEMFVCFILKIFGLEDIAQTESMELCIKLDGAELCDGISHLTAGIKVTDARAVDPSNGSPLCMMNVETFG